MLEHRYDIRISESYIYPNPLMVEIQDPDNFTRFQTQERCALEIAAYVFKNSGEVLDKLKARDFNATSLPTCYFLLFTLLYINLLVLLKEHSIEKVLLTLHITTEASFSLR